MELSRRQQRRLDATWASARQSWAAHEANAAARAAAFARYDAALPRVERAYRLLDALASMTEAGELGPNSAQPYERAASRGEAFVGVGGDERFALKYRDAVFSLAAQMMYAPRSARARALSARVTRARARARG